MADILEMACRKRRLPNSKDWALLLDDRSVLIPLDRTVTSLQERNSLIIMKRSLLDTLEPGQGKKPGRSNDPNGAFVSIVRVLLDGCNVVFDISSVDIRQVKALLGYPTGRPRACYVQSSLRSSLFHL